MFSYRHAFHAGNHADVLKHTVLIATLRYLLQKDTALAVLDTHAGTGLYRLDGDFASTSGEAAHGITRLLEQPEQALAPMLQDYVQMVRHFNGERQGSKLRNYPGSPALLHHLLRGQDQLRLCELLPVDARALAGNMLQLQELQQSMGSKPCQLQVLTENGFAAVKRFLPPPSRRGLLLCDPSYEIKSDYGKVVALIDESLRRFATGCYAVWYPIVARHEAHDLPKRLKVLAEKAGKNWLHATLTVKGGRQLAGLPGSGMFLMNPPYVLKEGLGQALPQLVQWLGQDKYAGFTLESAGL